MRVTKYKTILDDNRIVSLVKEDSVNYPYASSLHDPVTVHRLMCEVFQHDKQTEEYLYLLCVNAKNKLIGCFEISHGTVNASLRSPREIFQKAFLCNAAGFILAHNHPSGDIAPSNDDIQTYRKIKAASGIMGIRFLDNITLLKRAE